MKTAYIITGPIACGKSTLLKYLLDKKIIPNIYFLSNDSIYYSNYSNLNIPIEEKYNLAKKECEEKLNNLVNNGESFILENVCAKNVKFEFINKLKNNGYKIVVHFVSVNNVEISIDRSLKRAQNGYLDVNEEKICDRYKKSLENINLLLNISDELHIYDNSNDSIKKIYLKKGDIIQIFDKDNYIFKYLK